MRSLVRFQLAPLLPPAPTRLAVRLRTLEAQHLRAFLARRSPTPETGKMPIGSPLVRSYSWSMGDELDDAELDQLVAATDEAEITYTESDADWDGDMSGGEYA